MKPKTLAANLLDYLVYVCLRTGVMLIQVFPIEVMQLVARGLGNLLFALSSKYRQRAIENVTRSFPDWSPHHARTVARKCCQHMVMLGMEILSLAKVINRNNWYDYVEMTHIDEALRIILDDRGILLITGHFGNWELMGYAIGALGVRSYAIARPIDNPFIDRWLLRHRQETGQTIISKFGATDLMLKVVQSQHPLCFVADQHAGSRGLWVDFFGRPASTYKSIALLAMDQNCPIAVGGAWRLGNRFRFRAEIVDVIDPADYARDKDAVIHITQRYTKAIETLIRKAPEQYLWMHRRWREPPPPRKKKTPRPKPADQPSQPAASTTDAPAAPAPEASAPPPVAPPSTIDQTPAAHEAPPPVDQPTSPPPAQSAPAAPADEPPAQPSKRAKEKKAAAGDVANKPAPPLSETPTLFDL